MSKFDTAELIGTLRRTVDNYHAGMYPDMKYIDEESIVAIIARLEQYERNERLIEAAKKVDKEECLYKLDFLRRMAGEDEFGFIRYRKGGKAIFPTAQIRALLAAIPEPK